MSAKSAGSPRQFMTIFTYLLRSQKDKSYYTGITENCDFRIKQHNTGKVESTKNRRPWDLVFSKPHENYSEARKHEKWLKKKNREYKDKLGGVKQELKRDWLAPSSKRRGKEKQKVRVKRVRGGILIRDWKR